MLSKEEDWYACYQVLGISVDSTWGETQKAYRRLAQSSHPDRFDDGTNEKKEAEFKIVEINQAYHALSSFYKENRRLPGERIGRPSPSSQEMPTDPPEKPDFHWNSSTSSEKFRPKGAPSYRFRIPKVKTILFIVLIIIIYQFDFSSDSDQLSTEMAQIHDGEQTEPSVTNQPTTSVTDFGNKKFFTPGSTMGEVYMIQGTPSRTEGSTWYYGKSWVTFVNGVVRRWKDDVEDPLKIKPSDPVSRQRTSHSRLTSRFTTGSSKADVEAVQGRPTDPTENTWDYGLSKVYFRNGKVVSWSSSPLQPLKVN